MPEYVMRGTLELHGVDFFVEADDEEQARRKIKDGEFGRYEISGAEAVNWDIDAATIQTNT